MDVDNKVLSICTHCPRREHDAANHRLVCRENGLPVYQNAAAKRCPLDLFAAVACGPDTPTEQISRFLFANHPVKLPSGWQHWENVQAIYRAKLAEEASTLKPWAPDTWTWKGRGIVICGGGKYFAAAYATIRAIRHLGCTLPIELWNLPLERPTKWQEEAVRAINVKFRWVHQYERCDNGWGLKFHAIDHSNFAQVLLLDADCYPIADPTAAFDWPEFSEHGCVLWCDPPMEYPKPGARITPQACEAMGIPYSDEPAKDSGIILIDKTRHMRGLSLADWMSREHHHYYYRDIAGNGGYSYGDKDLLWLAMRYVGESYYNVVMPWYHMPPGGMHFTPGCRGFAFHRFNGKLTLAPTSVGLFPLTTQNPKRDDSLPLESEMHGFIEDLRAIRTKHRPRVHGVFVCVNYADYLEQTVKSLLPHADTWTAVTIAGDPAIELCSKHGIEAILSDRVHFAGSKFNLGALRNDVYQHVAKTDPDTWIMSIDPDCQFPPELRSIFDDIDLDPENIYGAKREGGETTDHQCSGFFQLFHPSQVRAGRLYREDWIDAGWTDIWFKDLWPAENRVSVTAAVVRHLGRPYLDHAGRVSGKADGRMAKRDKTDQERWDEFHHRPAESPDLSREPRWHEWFDKDLRSDCSCKANWRRAKEKRPLRLYDREAYTRSGWELHNDVNTDPELRKPFFPWADACAKYDWPDSLYPEGKPTAPSPTAIKVFGLQRCATNLAALLVSANYLAAPLSEAKSGWKHGRYVPGYWSAAARFILCVRHPLSHLARFYAYCSERLEVDATIHPQFRPGMTFAEFLSTPCYEFESPAHRWSAMYAHWLEALPPERTVIVCQEDQLADQSWIVGMIGRRLGLVPLGEPVTELRRVDVNRILRDEPVIAADLSIFTPELLALTVSQIDMVLLTYFGYSLVIS